MLNQDAEKVMQKADALSKDFERLVKNVDRILFYMEDDPATNKKGLISRFESLEVRVSSMETLDKIKKGKKSVWVLIGSGITAILLNADKLISSITKLFN